MRGGRIGCLGMQNTEPDNTIQQNINSPVAYDAEPERFRVPVEWNKLEKTSGAYNFAQQRHSSLC
jgi:hypothetical protein